MRRWILPTLLVCLILPTSRAGDKGTAKPLEEFHEVATLDGNRIGTRHVTIIPAGEDRSRFRTTATLELSLKRYGSTVRLRREEATIETREGTVHGIFMRQGIPGGRQLTIVGKRDGDDMLVSIDSGRLERKLAWSDDIVGIRQLDRQFAVRKPKVGDKFHFRRYEPTYNAVLTVRVEVKGRETHEVMGVRQSLLRADLTPDRLEGGGQTIRPPREIWWLDDSAVPVRRQFDLDGLGSVVLTRTTREKAAIGPALVDIGARSLVPLDRAITRPYETRSVLYRITVNDEESPGTVFVRDAHQEVRNVRSSSFELLVHPVRPGGATDPGKLSENYLISCHFIDHDDDRIKEIARRAVGTEMDPWKKAQRIERWVKNLMRNDNETPLVSASQIARSPRGDCRHHAFLTAALCRAQGIPSRTAIGLLYVHRGGPKLGFHMWCEVHIDGKWIGLDSTLGKGGVSATHLKITEHHWADTSSLTPLLPVNRVLGKLRVQVLRSE
jgi:transglutaminase-like putative cysteine protease